MRRWIIIALLIGAAFVIISNWRQFTIKIRETIEHYNQASLGDNLLPGLPYIPAQPDEAPDESQVPSIYSPTNEAPSESVSVEMDETKDSAEHDRTSRTEKSEEAENTDQNIHQSICNGEFLDYMPVECSKGEALMREALERICKAPFPRVRPNFLRNPETGFNLELDCYNEKLKIAAEYNGRQHYQYPNKFHKSIQEFIAQLRRDQYKRKLCERHGIYFLVVPYCVAEDKIYDFVRQHLPNHH